MVPATRGRAGSKPGRTLPMPRFGDMLKHVPEEIFAAPPPPSLNKTAICGVHHDSRRVIPGGIFVALSGREHDGLDFVPQAEAAGASLIAADRDPGCRTPWLKVRAPRQALAHLADAFYDHPSGALKMVGVTGTNGKTSVCWLLQQAWLELGLPAAALGTLGPRAVSAGGEAIEIPWPAHTTPEAPDFQAALAALAAAGIRHVACEVSSHALALERVRATQYRAVVFTNLGRDHLDFHASLRDYRDAKWRLFRAEDRACPGEQTPAAVVNLDDPAGRDLAALLQRRGLQTPAGLPGAEPGLLTYGIADGSEAWLQGEILEADIHGLRLTARWPGGAATLRTGLLGRFQSGPLLAALGSLLALGTPGEAAAHALSRAAPVPGRMEALRAPGRGLIIVDYAHTPEALETVLREGRGLAEGRLVVVFGCGGERDPGKRPLMGAIAGQLADEVIVTNDNPRREEPQEIAAQILDGVRAASARRDLILDREEALAEGVRRVGPGDVLLVAGRGAEAWQDCGASRRPLDDRKVLRRILDGAAGSRAG
ncbi:MAG: UDP-N-acetylmuramoyl-L-alanyl-D-glutamate--2,6-diaminopimelate ligase [Candidatus Eisenbacteria bacterium]|nr:UDP-N-acetylmuramoyl-L-alanyl-D-glutamate--2,6-diaminopimelate ligase [Candidatus Eisenbacteria bacterium]